MVTILYIGNKLSDHGYGKGVIEHLGPGLEAEGIQVYYAGETKNSIARLCEMLYKVWKYRNRVSCILIDTYSTNAFWFAWASGFLASWLKIKYITILHGGNLPQRIKKSKQACNLLFGRAHKNIAVSGYLKAAFDMAGYSCDVIFNSVDISKLPFREREQLKPRILWVRAFSEIYNPNLAAATLEILIKTWPDAELCMVGPEKDGSLGAIKKFISERKLDSSVTITGVLSLPNWVALSKDYDIFINTTNVDNTPLSLIEAMALGMPVVSTNVGGVPFLVKNGVEAVLVEPENPEAMANAIKSLLQNPVLAKSLSINGRIKASQFDWEVIKEKWIKILRE